METKNNSADLKKVNPAPYESEIVYHKSTQFELTLNNPN